MKIITLGARNGVFEGVGGGGEASDKTRGTLSRVRPNQRHEKANKNAAARRDALSEVTIVDDRHQNGHSRVLVLETVLVALLEEAREQPLRRLANDRKL